MKGIKKIVFFDNGDSANLEDSFFHDYCEWLRNQGFETIYLGCGKTPFSARCEALGTIVEQSGIPGASGSADGFAGGIKAAALGPLKSAGDVRTLEKKLKTMAPCAVFTISNHAHLIGLAAGRMSGAKVFWHIREFFSPRAKFAFTSISALSPSGIICASEYLSAPFAGTGKVSIAYEGVSMSSLPSAPTQSISEELGLREGRLVIGTTGRWNEFSGFQVFLEAAQIVLNRVPDLHFVIAGATAGEEKEDEEAINEFIGALKSYSEQEGVSDRTSFISMPVITPELLASFDIYSQAGTFQVPTGRTAITAMALSKPVIASSAGCLPEFVVNGMTGMVIPEDREDILASSILQLVENPEVVSAFGKNAREIAEKKFSTSAIFEKITGLLG